MHKVSAEIVVDAPAEKVWEVLADFGGIHKWAPAITNSYSTSKYNGGPEASRHCDIAGFGSVEEDITDWIEGSEFKYRATAIGPIGESTSRWSVTPVGGKSRVYGDLEFNVRFGPIGALMYALMMRRLLKKAMRNTVAGLKHHVETGELVGRGFRASAAA